ncbi:BQ5605_C002g01170 [Microbotryum silenes-dioicae]|uniref:BQ5605_C002g01170 protein n=1 Tax=Microbotryum silenes-dioicae TaxID=796604 RepID=A0A2X0M2I5_9BASI|nr:BQ5605_C002g01170 [Microbotryum silenes-dioicae]
MSLSLNTASAEAGSSSGSGGATPPSATTAPAPASSSRRSRSKSVSQHLDPSALSFARAYAIGFTASILPSLLRILVPLVTGKKPRSVSRVARQVWDAIVCATHYNGLALAFGVSIGGAKWGEDKIERLVASAYVSALSTIRPRRTSNILPGEDDRDRSERAGGQSGVSQSRSITTEQVLQDPMHARRIKILSTLISGTIASFVSISLLQSRPTKTSASTSASGPVATAAGAAPNTSVKEQGARIPNLGFSPYTALNDPLPPLRTNFSTPLPPIVPSRQKESSTLDLTLFLFVRAADTLVRSAYEKTGLTTRPDRFGLVSRFVAMHADTLLFWASCWRIMWCFFYLPHRLPKAYNLWILRLARLDVRLLSDFGWQRLLQYARKGEYVYGKSSSTEVVKTCKGIATYSGISAERVIPDNITRLDCSVIHGRVGKGTCEANAIKRWLLAFSDCFKIYLPVHLVPSLLFGFGSLARQPVASIIRILLAASRSSAFLATFVASIYASVCLMRTRLPMLFPFISQQAMDGGWCTGLGCFLCGLSVLIENKRRRREMALYCAPRALYTVLDSIVPQVVQNGPMGVWLAKWGERALFALSTGTVVSATVHRPDLVSGVVRGILGLAVGDWDGKAVKQIKKISSK